MMHTVERTSPKGEQFIGTCVACGKQGLTLAAAARETCSNPDEVSNDDLLLAAIDGGGIKEDGMVFYRVKIDGRVGRLFEIDRHGIIGLDLPNSNSIVWFKPDEVELTDQSTGQCCDLDTDHDGNCPVHSAPGVPRPGCWRLP